MRRLFFSLSISALFSSVACNLPQTSDGGNSSSSGGGVNHVFCGQAPGIYRVMRSAGGAEVPGLVTPQLGVWNKSENVFTYYTCPGMTDENGWHPGAISGYGIIELDIYYATTDCSGTGYFAEHLNYDT